MKLIILLLIGTLILSGCVEEQESEFIIFQDSEFNPYVVINIDDKDTKKMILENRLSLLSDSDNKRDN